jgi:oxidase EvaA
MVLITKNINSRNINLLFLKSIYSKEHSHLSTASVLNWLKEQNTTTNVNIEKVHLENLNNWHYDEKVGSLRHNSGKFFTIDGIHIKTNWGNVPEWEQPIINQSEIGYLGFITKEINGILNFLMQAKIEPGNVNYLQLSPTLQATRSNYSQVHYGKKPLYLEYFQKAKPYQILLDQLQSEQGARFLKKRNRNIIIKIDEEIPIYDGFIWLTLHQIKSLIKHDNLINMDTRTVISCIPLGGYEPEVIEFINFFGNEQNESKAQFSFLKSALSSTGGLHSIENIITFITQIKSVFDLEITKVPLDKLQNWIFSKTEIYHKESKYFKVIAVDVEIGNREVVKWSQPMIEPAQEGLCGFICKEINGILHFAVQAKLECGNHDIIEFAPTVQCLTGNYRQTKEVGLPFLDYLINAKSEQIVLDTMQSEEGGRFYKEQNRNMIVIADDKITIDLPDNFIWMTLHQLYTFLKFNNYLNIQARSLIASISFVDFE